MDGGLKPRHWAALGLLALGPLLAGLWLLRGLPDPRPLRAPAWVRQRALEGGLTPPEALEALFLRPQNRGELLRAKGICAFKDWPARHDGSDRWAFQWADGRLEVSPLPAAGAPAPLVAVVIGLGLDWDAHCLAPHTNRYAVETASQWQVRQPIYRHSLEHWRHYEKHLAPLKEKLPGLLT